MTNEEIINSNEFKQLYDIKRHVFSNTAEHSLRVANYMSKMARFIHMDKEAAVRVGLLHDLCYVDQDERKQRKEQNERYVFYHPEDAYTNASAMCKLSKEEANAIRTHMFPISRHLPRGKLSWCLTIADKVAAVSDFMVGLMILGNIIT